MKVGIRYYGQDNFVIRWWDGGGAEGQHLTNAAREAPHLFTNRLAILRMLDIKGEIKGFGKRLTEQDYELTLEIKLEEYGRTVVLYPTNNEEIT